MFGLDDTAIAIVIALALTLLIVVIELASQSKASLRACFSWIALLYLTILAVGNSVTTLLASVAVEGRLPNSLTIWHPFFCAFFGVFAFEGVLGNTNVTIFDRGLLTIQDWIAKARDPAIAKAISNNVGLVTNAANRSAEQLRLKVPDQDLNAFIDQKFGNGTAVRLHAEAQKGGADPRLYKALEFASTVETAAILKARR